MSRSTLGGFVCAALVASTTACEKRAADVEEPTRRATTVPATAKPITGEALAAKFDVCTAHVNERRWDAMKAECYTPDAVVENLDSGMPPTRTADEAVAIARAYTEVFPDLRTTAQIVLVKESNLVAVTHLAGTNTAPLRGLGPDDVPATNRKVGLLLVEGVEVDDQGRAIRQWTLMDDMSMMGQLGLLPADMRFRAASEPRADTVVAIAKHDDLEARNVEIYRAEIEAINTKDLDALAELTADDMVWSDQSEPRDQSKAEMLAGLKEFFAAFPDFTLQATSVWGAGDYVVAMGRMTGTQEGDFMGRKKTGKKIDLQVVEIAHFEDGKQDAGWLFLNGMAAAQQLGMMSSGEATGEPERK